MVGPTRLAQWLNSGEVWDAISRALEGFSTEPPAPQLVDAIQEALITASLPMKGSAVDDEERQLSLAVDSNADSIESDAELLGLTVKEIAERVIEELKQRGVYDE